MRNKIWDIFFNCFKSNHRQMFRYSFTFTYHIVYYRSFLWQHINNTIFRSFPSPKQRSNFSRNRRIKDAALIFRQISFRFANSRVNNIPGVKSKRWIEATREWNFNQLTFDTIRVEMGRRFAYYHPKGFEKKGVFESTYVWNTEFLRNSIEETEFLLNTK